MKKVTTRVTLDEKTFRSKVRLESEPCQPDTPQSTAEQFRLLKILADQPDLTACSLAPFQKMSIYHDGTVWVAEAEATITQL